MFNKLTLIRIVSCTVLLVIFNYNHILSSVPLHDHNSAYDGVLDVCDLSADVFDDDFDKSFCVLDVLVVYHAQEFLASFFLRAYDDVHVLTV